MADTRHISSAREIVGVICGSLLVGVPLLSTGSVAIPVAQANPCPNTCPALSQIMQPPLEQIQPPSATVTPINGRVNINLVNQTNTPISYQVVGDTQERILSGNSNVMLQDIKMPVAIAFVRPDGGLLLVRPRTPQTGMLEVNLVDTTNVVSLYKNAMMIQENGNVFVN